MFLEHYGAGVGLGEATKNMLPVVDGAVRKALGVDPNRPGWWLGHEDFDSLPSKTRKMARKYGLFATAAYGLTTDLQARISQYGYKVVTIFDDDDNTGFRFAAFKNDISGHTILAFAGTDGMADMDDNRQQAFGKESAQYKMAVKVADFMSKTHGSNLTITGHSLGGGLATTAAVMTGKEAVTFNSAAVHRNTISNMNVSAANVTHFFSDKDALQHVNYRTPGILPGRQVMVRDGGYHQLGPLCSAMGGC